MPLGITVTSQVTRGHLGVVQEKGRNGLRAVHFRDCLKFPAGRQGRALGHTPIWADIMGSSLTWEKAGFSIGPKTSGSSTVRLPVPCGCHFCLGITTDFPDLLFQATDSSQTDHNFTRKILEIWAK